MEAEVKLDLERLSREIRKETLKSIASAGKGHVGGSLSVAEVLAVLYGGVMNYDPKDPNMRDRDYLVLSKGHAGPALYAVLAVKGFFPREMLYTLNRPGTNLPSHADRNRTPGIDMSTGSLGQGASTAAGLAYACKLNKTKQTVYLILGDGECNEGQVWEMALFCANYRMDNLVVFIDKNNMQSDGCTRNICDMGDLDAKFASFEFHVQHIDGHNVEEIGKAVEKAKGAPGKPHVIIMDTVKGKGIKEVEQMTNCHSIAVSKEQLDKYLAELDAKE